MKVYLAGPMRGIDKHNFPAFHRAAERLRAKGYEVFNPAEKSIEAEYEPGMDNTLKFRRRVFAMDFAWICEHADAVALLPGWQYSRGAVAEHGAAVALGLWVIQL